jgi:hypothetical protein
MTYEFLKFFKRAGFEYQTLIILGGNIHLIRPITTGFTGWAREQ